MNIKTGGRVGADEAAAALSLAAAAAEADGVSPLSEQIRLHLRFGGDPAARNLFLWRGSELAGFAHLDPPDPAEGSSGELVVHPKHRRQGHGRELAGAVVAQAGPLPVRIWAHGDLPAAAGLARSVRFARVRALWQMMRSLPPDTPEMPTLPAGVTLRTFVPGQDEDAWLALNHRAFATHPEQGRWTRDDLARRENEPWFDPAGFFLAERDGRLVAFHWTKIHEPGETREGHAAVGEVYVLGVDPAEQGTGLGRLLTLAGLRHLAARGIKTVLLYVDESNQSAVRLYEKLSFTHTSTDVMYQHTPPGRSGAHASR